MGVTAMTLAVCPMKNALLHRTHAVIINVMAKNVAVILLVKGDLVAPALIRHRYRPLQLLRHQSILQVIIIIIIIALTFLL